MIRAPYGSRLAELRRTAEMFREKFDEPDKDRAAYYALALVLDSNRHAEQDLKDLLMFLKERCPRG